MWLVKYIVALFKLPTAIVEDHSHQALSTIPQTTKETVVANVSAITTGVTTESSSIQAGLDHAFSPIRRSQVSSASATGAWVEYGILFWALGALLVLSHWFLGFTKLVRLQMTPVLEEDAITALGAASQRVGLNRMPQLFASSQVTGPMTFGHFRPRIVLPVEAMDWGKDALRVVFLHECAHVWRSDWMLSMLSRVVSAVYWFNPLVWLAARQFRAECEALADDTVLLSGISPAQYASELLRIAMDIHPQVFANSLAIFDAGDLKKRIEQLLEKNRSRGSASRKIIGISLLVSLALSTAIGVSYQVIDAPMTAQNGYLNLGKGKHVRIIAVVKRTATGTQAWNLRGELLPNSIPLPDGIDSGESPSESLRYIVFAGNGPNIAIQEAGHRSLNGAQRMDTVSSNHAGWGYYVSHIDGDSLSVAKFLPNGADFISIRCEVWSVPVLSPRDWKAGTVVEFERVPLNPTGHVAISTDLDVPLLKPAPEARVPGALIGLFDFSHPEWGFWRPDGSPMPPIRGITAPRATGGSHPQGNITRQVGFLFRSRSGSVDGVGMADTSGVLLSNSTSYFYTIGGRYDLDAVFLAPGLHSMRLFSKVPKADRVVAHLKLTQVPQAKQSEKISQFFGNRIAPGAICFSFDKGFSTASPGITRSLQFLRADHSIITQADVSTDWDDSAVEVQTEHPEQIVAANVLEHGHEYFSYPDVALFPKWRH